MFYTTSAMSTHNNKIDFLLFNIVNYFNECYPSFYYPFEREIEFLGNLIKIFPHLSFNVSFNCHKVFRGEERLIRGKII